MIVYARLGQQNEFENFIDDALIKWLLEKNDERKLLEKSEMLLQYC